MKKLMIVLMASMFILSCNNVQKTEDSATDNLVAEWVELTLKVEGMTCGGCENAIKKAVESLEGIASVESSFDEGWTKVKYDKSSTNLAEIEGKISDTGYEVKGKL